MDKRATLEEAERKTAEIGRIIGDQMPKGWGFALLVFSFGEDGFMNWISNTRRADMVKALRECADSESAIPPSRAKSKYRKFSTG